MKIFSTDQKEAIEKKVVLLSPLFEEGLTEEEVYARAKSIEDKITKKRLKWFEENRQNMDYLSRDDLSDLQKAFGMLFGHYMKIFEGITAIPLEDESSDRFYAVLIVSSNFCPYLEAMKQMGVSPDRSVWTCQNVLEKPCQALVDKINPALKFERLYWRIRPLASACVERIRLTYFPELEDILI